MPTDNVLDAYDARRTEIAVTAGVPSRPTWADVGSLTEIAGRLRDVAEFAERMRG